MSRSYAPSFNRNLRNFLGSTSVGSMWVDRITQMTRVSRSRRSLSVNPVNSVEGTFAAQDGFESADHMAGFNAYTRQILAHDVLESLIQIQSDMSEPEDHVTVSAHTATDAYRHALAGMDAL